MRNLQTKINRFFLQNRDKGIPNLMLYIALGNAVVTVMSMINGGTFLYYALYFDKAKILQGEVWRLVTYVFTQSSGGFLGLILLYFFYMLGRQVEASMGTFKFNLFYLSGVVLMDVFAMLFATPGTAVLYMDMAYYLHLSLVLTFATTFPESQFMILYIIPVKAWVLALVYLGLTLIDIINLSTPVLHFPHNLFPLVALGNYFLFTGSDIKNIFPLSWRIKMTPKKPQPKQTGSVPFRQTQKKDYLHRCEICGKTDVSNPELEFRYCSRCNGYHCYCQDHISNHTHID